MNKLSIKTEVLNKQKEIILNLEGLINEHKSLSDIDENETRDLDDFSHQDESTEMVLSLNEQLDRATKEFELLNSLSEEKSDSIKLGALFQTDMGVFYVSLPGTILYNDEKIYCISTKAPFYSSINNKKVGDEFTFNNEKHKVTAIY